MPDLDLAVCVLPLDGALLDAQLVARLDAQIKVAGATARVIVVDCAKLDSVTPQGLSALLELGSRVSSIWRVALAGLSRPVTHAAIQVGLAERFPIYASAEAARRALSAHEV